MATIRKQALLDKRVLRDAGMVVGPNDLAVLTVEGIDLMFRSRPDEADVLAPDMSASPTWNEISDGAQVDIVMKHCASEETWPGACAHVSAASSAAISRLRARMHAESRMAAEEQQPRVVGKDGFIGGALQALRQRCDREAWVHTFSDACGPRAPSQRLAEHVLVLLQPALAEAEERFRTAGGPRLSTLVGPDALRTLQDALEGQLDLASAEWAERKG
jgi:hypothetical protein